MSAKTNVVEKNTGDLDPSFTKQTPLSPKPVPRQQIIWLIKDGECLPIDDGARMMRTGFLAEKLIEKGFKVVWFAGRFDHARHRQRKCSQNQIEVKSGLTVQLLDGCGYRTNISALRVLNQIMVARSFRKISKSYPRPDLIVISYPTPDLASSAAKFAQRNGIPYFVDFRDPWPDTFNAHISADGQLAVNLLSKYYRRIIKKIISGARGVISMSDVMLNWALGYANRKKQVNDSVFYLGYERRKRLRELTVPQMFTREKPLNCVFVGTFGKSYDGLLVIEAARYLSERGISAVRFTLVGDGECADTWRKTAAGLTNVSFTGWLSEEELSRQLNHSHLGIVPMTGGVAPYWLGNKFFEYCSYGLPLLSTVPGEAEHLISHYGIGTTVNSCDIQGFAEAIIRYVRDPFVLCEQMRNAVSVFDEQFRADKVYEDYAKHILSVLNDENVVVRTTEQISKVSNA